MHNSFDSDVHTLRLLIYINIHMQLFVVVIKHTLISLPFSSYITVALYVTFERM